MLHNYLVVVPHPLLRTPSIIQTRLKTLLPVTHYIDPDTTHHQNLIISTLISITLLIYPHKHLLLKILSFLHKQPLLNLPNSPPILNLIRPLWKNRLNIIQLLSVNTLKKSELLVYLFTILHFTDYTTPYTLTLVSFFTKLLVK
jgi:hypothetical protein